MPAEGDYRQSAAGSPPVVMSLRLTNGDETPELAQTRRGHP